MHKTVNKKEPNGSLGYSGCVAVEGYGRGHDLFYII